MNREPQKITTIHIVQHLAPGGLESLVIDLLHFASPHNHVFIMSLEGEHTQAIQNWPKLSAYQDRLLFLGKSSGWCLKTLVQLQKLFRCLRPDVVHTHHIGPLLYGGLAAKHCKVPLCIHTEHDVWHLENKRHRLLEKLILKWVHPILVGDANLVTETIRSYFHHPKTITIKNGVDCHRFSPGNQHAARMQLNLPNHVHLIGSAGRLEWVKGHDQVIQALAQLPEHIHLAIAGKGSQAENLRHLADTLSLTSRVHFLGLVEDMTTFYRALDLFCLPSRSEGFPLSPLEAQACDIPVVVTDVGAAKETLCHDTGVAITVEQSDSLTQALELALTRAVQRPLATSPRQFVKQQCDIRHMVNAYEGLAREAIR